MKKTASRSGPNIPEEQRTTTRVRLSKEAVAQATKLAARWGCSVPEAIARAVASA